MALKSCETCGFSYDPDAGKCPACTYAQATTLKDRAASFGEYETAAKLFLSAGGYRDADAQAALCHAAAEDCNREAIYNQAKKRQGVDLPSWQGKADLMRSIAGYRDADELAAAYQQEADTLAAAAENDRLQKEEEQRQHAQSAHADHKRRRKFLLLGIGTATAILVIVLVVSLAIMPSLQYKKAVSLYNQTHYAAAAKAFAAVSPYKDSDAFLALSYYQLGLQAVAEGNDLAALDFFAKAGTAEDAPAQLYAAKGRLYDTAMNALESGDFATAEERFDAANDYADAKAYRHFCRAVRVWNRDPAAEANKLNLEKAAAALTPAINRYAWYCDDVNRELAAGASLTIQNNALLWEIDGVAYTVEMYALERIRLIGSGPLAGVYERQS